MPANFLEDINNKRKKGTVVPLYNVLYSHTNFTL